MELDDEVCLCFHVTKRKLLNFLRVEKPRRVAQLSECFGAGTGCGWCRPYLRRCFESAAAGAPQEEPTPAEYAQQRAKYVLAGGGTPPPGATPIGDAVSATEASVCTSRHAVLPPMSPEAIMADPTQPDPLEIDCRAVKQKLDAGDDFLLIDCREKSEAEIVRIQAARLLPMSELTTRVDELAPYRDRAIVVHCHHGGRSMRVTEWLRQQGYAHAQSMAGGIDQWAAEIDTTLPRY